MKDGHLHALPTVASQRVEENTHDEAAGLALPRATVHRTRHAGIPPFDEMLPSLDRDEHPRVHLGDPDQRSLKSFQTNRIQVGRGARALNIDWVDALMGSISSIGLRSPITVRIVPKTMVDGVEEQNVPVLVAGLHRLEAGKKLRRQ